MLLRYSKIHITITLRDFLYLVYERNHHWLNPYDCCFLVSMYKRKPVRVQENKRKLARCTEKSFRTSRNLPKKHDNIKAE